MSEFITPAHRALMQRIQDLCIDISLADVGCYATYDYSGHVHTVDVRVVPDDGTHDAAWTGYARLPAPGYQQRGPAAALGELADIINHLESLLPGGAP